MTNTKSSKSTKNKALPTAKKAERTGPFLMPKSSEAGRYTAVSRKVSRRAFCKEHVNQQTKTFYGGLTKNQLPRDKIPNKL